MPVLAGCSVILVRGLDLAVRLVIVEVGVFVHSETFLLAIWQGAVLLIVLEEHGESPPLLSIPFRLHALFQVFVFLSDY